jgi:hypothetical protein
MGSSIGSYPEPRLAGTIAQYVSIHTVNSIDEVAENWVLTRNGPLDEGTVEVTNSIATTRLLHVSSRP